MISGYSFKLVWEGAESEIFSQMNTLKTNNNNNNNTEEEEERLGKEHIVIPEILLLDASLKDLPDSFHTQHIIFATLQGIGESVYTPPDLV